MPTISSHHTLQASLKSHCHHLRELITFNERLAYEIEALLHIKPAENEHYWATAAASSSSSRAGPLDKSLHLLRDEQIDELWVDQLEERVEAAGRWAGVLRELNGEMKEEMRQLKKWERRERKAKEGGGVEDERKVGEGSGKEGNKSVVEKSGG